MPFLMVSNSFSLSAFILKTNSKVFPIFFSRNRFSELSSSSSLDSYFLRTSIKPSGFSLRLSVFLKRNTSCISSQLWILSIQDYHLR